MGIPIGFGWIYRTQSQVDIIFYPVMGEQRLAHPKGGGGGDTGVPISHLPHILTPNRDPNRDHPQILTPNLPPPTICDPQFPTSHIFLSPNLPPPTFYQWSHF